MDKCPLCGNRLQIGTDTRRNEYDPEYKAKFEAGEITLDELLLNVHRYIDRTMLCPNAGNENNMVHADGTQEPITPPCPNYYGKNGGTMEVPAAIVEIITFEDQ